MDRPYLTDPHWPASTNQTGGMFVLVLIGILVSIIKAQAAVSNGYETRMQPAELSSKWHYFYFTGAGSTVSSATFSVHANDGDAIQITDMFCAGDRFTMLMDIPQLNLKMGFNTSTVATSCAPYTTDPWQAYNSGSSRLSYTFPEALSANLTIKVVASPHSNGAAVIRQFPRPPNQLLMISFPRIASNKTITWHHITC